MKTYSEKFKKLSNRKKMHILREWQRYLDEFVNQHSVVQQSIYTRLFWLSIGQGEKQCQVSFAELRGMCNIKADSTMSKNINDLVRMKHLKIVDRSFSVKTIYRVFTPLEITTPGGKGGKK